MCMSCKTPPQTKVGPLLSVCFFLLREENKKGAEKSSSRFPLPLRGTRLSRGRGDRARRVDSDASVARDAREDGQAHAALGRAIVLHPWRCAQGGRRRERRLGLVHDLAVHVRERGLWAQEKRWRLAAWRRLGRHWLCRGGLVRVGRLDGQADQVAEPLQRPLPRDGHGRRHEGRGDGGGGERVRGGGRGEGRGRRDLRRCLLVGELLDDRAVEAEAGDIGRQRQRGGGRRWR